LDRVSSSASLLPPGDQSLKAHNLRLKLIHINATAKLESPDYRGPFLPAEMLSAAEPASEKVTLLQSRLREALAGVLGGRDNGRFDVRTVYGWQIGECASSPWDPVGFCLAEGVELEGSGAAARLYPSSFFSLTPLCFLIAAARSCSHSFPLKAEQKPSPGHGCG